MGEDHDTKDSNKVNDVNNSQHFDNPQKNGDDERPPSSSKPKGQTKSILRKNRKVIDHHKELRKDT
eukprot:CAMPEP_0114583604 /NCGR_PEP_ID=MMETSP0125-20121206/7290_1 /TAXON_ID=485358 ORGANISM="Aristerostoma sp., Strain ATCC 50986" /NCGR_SAMPLE_ID=MMETSP0125 /ASSEMBLY_ACC=CAM_ASM_000245 /LENGTH=65 /DNA_ID=CAMNT_0001777133 /DNA_START=200 /DNA_END=397 /DNA_ORIENTATION=+